MLGWGAAAAVGRQLARSTHRHCSLQRCRSFTARSRTDAAHVRSTLHTIIASQQNVQPAMGRQALE